MYATLPANAHLASLNNSIYMAVIARSAVCRITPTESLSIIFQLQSAWNYLLSYTSCTQTLYNTHTLTSYNACTHTLIHSMSTPTHYNSHTHTFHNAHTHILIHSIMSTPTHYNSRTHTSHKTRTHTSYNAESRHWRMGHCVPGRGRGAGWGAGGAIRKPPNHAHSYTVMHHTRHAFWSLSQSASQQPVLIHLIMPIHTDVSTQLYTERGQQFILSF